MPRNLTTLFGSVRRPARIMRALRSSTDALSQNCIPCSEPAPSSHNSVFDDRDCRSLLGFEGSHRRLQGSRIDGLMDHANVFQADCLKGACEPDLHLAALALRPARRELLCWLGLAVTGLTAGTTENLIAPAKAQSAVAAGPGIGDARDDPSPWGVASGAEWQNQYPRFNPVLNRAGVTWLRAFQEWQSLEPTRGHFNWARADHMVESARANNLHLTWVLAYLAPWASADGGTRKFPIKDITNWRAFVSAVVTRYHRDIKYWEVWNEFNGSFAEGGTPAIYAQLVQEASVVAKAIDPTAKVGLSVANFDVHYLEASIKAGAAGHFDYVCVHPYEKMGQIRTGGQAEFLSMTGSLRRMLAANQQPQDMPLWITEIGDESSTRPDQQADDIQAIALSKAYLLSLAAGFQKIFWFEAQGPSFGLIRPDSTVRPCYTAYKTMTALLGRFPQNSGWLDFEAKGFGFLFGNGAGFVLAVWAASNSGAKASFPGDVEAIDLAGNQKQIKAGQALVLTETPIFIRNLPEQTIRAARQNKDRPYPWEGRYDRAQSVTLRLGTINAEDGLRQINPDTTVPVTVDNEAVRRLNFARKDQEGHYAYFSVDPDFVSNDGAALEITVLARRIALDKTAGFSLTYESNAGYVETGYANVPDTAGWHELKWQVRNAAFSGQWGWNFRINAIASPSEFLIKQIIVRRQG